MIALPVVSHIGAYAAPVAARPPDGTYEYRITIGGSEVGHSTVVISLKGGSVVVTERASLPQISATATSSYDTATLTQASYAADVNLARGSQHTAVEFKPRAVTVRVPGQSVDIAADPSAPLEIIGVQCPILILQGRADVEVLPNDLPRLAVAARSHNRDVSILLFPDDNHLFMKITPGEPLTPTAALSQYLTVPARIDSTILRAVIQWLGRRAR